MKIAILFGIAIAVIASNAIAGSGYHVDVNGVVCPVSNSGNYETDTWGQCVMNPRVMKLYFGNSWDEEKQWISGTLLFFLIIGPVIFLIIPLVPLLLSPVGKRTWAIGMCAWIILDGSTWGWLHRLLGI